MVTPLEFTKEYVEENSPQENQLFSGFLKSSENLISLF